MSNFNNSGEIDPQNLQLSYLRCQKYPQLTEIIACRRSKLKDRHAFLCQITDEYTFHVC